MNAAVRRLTLQGLMFDDVHKLTVDLSDLEDVSSAGLQFMLRYKGCKK
jgi:anti-anti-sigma regulatory factor